MVVNEEDMRNNFDLYVKYWVPFGELLTDMEREGIKVDIDYLKVSLIFFYKFLYFIDYRTIGREK